MTPRQFDRMVAALESGHYKQNTGALCDTATAGFAIAGAYCCIGVGGKANGFRNARGKYAPTRNMCVKLGIPRELGIQLVELNDKMGWDFPRIAQWMRANRDEFLAGGEA